MEPEHGGEQTQQHRSLHRHAHPAHADLKSVGGREQGMGQSRREK